MSGENKPIAVVLAAGKGTRMNSTLPKVLCQACGRPIIDYVLDALEAAGITRQLIVVGYRADDVRHALADRKHAEFVEQTAQLGTGHAVEVCRDLLSSHEGAVLVVAGDSPMLQADSVRAVLAAFQRQRPACAMGTLHRDDPTGLGRIVRDSEGEFAAIVEEKDATDEQRKITEVNMSTYVFDCQQLLGALSQLGNRNRQGEYYLTDCPGILKSENKKVIALPVLKPCEALSINTLQELAVVEAEMRRTGIGK